MVKGKAEAKIRKMTEADLQKVKDIDKELVGPYRSISWPVRVEAHWWIYRGMPSFVAEVNDEVVGFVLGDIRRVDRHDGCISQASKPRNRANACGGFLPGMPDAGSQGKGSCGG